MLYLNLKCLFQYKLVLLRFILHFSFSIAIAPLRNYFSLLKVDLNFKYFNYFKHFNFALVVTIFTSTMFIVFSIDLLNIALFLHFEFWFLILLRSFSASLRNFVLRSIYGFKNGSCLNSNIAWIFLIVALNLNEVLSCDSGVFIFFYCLD